MAVHELGHVLGLEHEHARQDRDDHVIINWNNVDDRKFVNFQTCTDCQTNIPYDYGSVMHYHSKVGLMSTEFFLIICRTCQDCQSDSDNQFFNCSFRICPSRYCFFIWQICGLPNHHRLIDSQLLKSRLRLIFLNMIADLEPL